MPAPNEVIGLIHHEAFNSRQVPILPNIFIPHAIFPLSR